MYASRGLLAKLNYMDIKQILDRKAIETRYSNNRGNSNSGTRDPQSSRGK
jgi:hypothetical protein